MLIDMHLHERTHSPDSMISLEEIVTVAKARGLDAVCITDHDSMGLTQYAAEYAKQVDFPIFVGVEFYSLQGDVTAWGIDSFPDHRVDAQDFIDHVNHHGGFCVSCHPFRNNNRGLEDDLKRVHGLHGVEVLNGSTSLEANRKALQYCQELGLKPIGASDAHVYEKIAKYVTWLPEQVFTQADLIAQLHACNPKPAIWNGLSYDIVDTF
ncbi:MAG: PHP domain-containing protein [Clostridiales bacterium]|nr:PHP domain-containing protein [Clostridiales bacterium]